MKNENLTQQFLAVYDDWYGNDFSTEEVDLDEIYDLRYDLYEQDAFFAGYWVRAVESDFKDIDKSIDISPLINLKRKALEVKKLARNSVDIQQIDSYIKIIKQHIDMYGIYKNIQTMIGLSKISRSN